MDTIRVLFKSDSAVDEFVKKASSLPYDVNLGSGSRVVDAKSLLGVLYLGLNKVHDLTAPKEQLKNLRSVFSDFLVA